MFLGKKNMNLNFSDIWWLIANIKYSRTIWDQIPSYFQNFLNITKSNLEVYYNIKTWLLGEKTCLMTQKISIQ
jgi:hypothetical protein